MSFMTGFFSPKQSIWASTGFPSMPLLFTVAVNNICFLGNAIYISIEEGAFAAFKLYTFDGCVVHQSFTFRA